jgi:hypothetical protein
MPMQAQTIQIDSTFTSDGEIFPFGPNDTIYGLTISGHVTLSSDTSLVRVILTDDSGNEWMVYEAYPMIVTDSAFDLEEVCDETCYLEEFHPHSLIIQIIDGEISISELLCSTTRYQNLSELQQQAKRSKDLEKVQLMNQYIASKDWDWIADTNEVVGMYYSEKVIAYYNKYNLLGRDYYSEGSFYTILHDCVPQYNDNTIISSFNWREKHNANLSGSPYWDHDPDDEVPGNGWMTGLRSQVCGSCSAFASIASLEAAINLYANYQFDVEEGSVENPVRFSERDAFVCSAFQGNVGCDCTGKFIYEILNKIRDYGVVNEECFPKVNTDYCPGHILNCSPPNTSKCTDPLWTASICQRDVYDLYDYESQIERSNWLKKLILDNGPLTAEIRSTHVLTVPGHAVSLIGFEFNQSTGQIDWIYKNSAPKSYCYEPLYLGSDGVEGCPYIVNNVNAFVYDEPCPLPDESPIMVSSSNEEFEYKVHENDFDKDGYYNWGIGEKPSDYHCSQEEDSNDDNNRIGPYEEDYSGRPVVPLLKVQFGEGLVGTEIKDDDVYNLDEENNSEDIDFAFQIKNTGNAQLNLVPNQLTEDRGTVAIESQSSPEYFEIKDSNLPDTSVCWSFGDNYTTFRITLKANAEAGATAHIYIYFEEEQGVEPVFEFTLIYNGCQTDAESYIVDNEQIWDGYRSQLKDVCVASHGVLTITGTVLLSPGVDIEVWPGGVLDIDGGTLTNSCENQLWNGIQVWGSNHCQSFPEYFGQVNLKNNAVIENARVAISNYAFTEVLQSGGIIYATDAIFRNNQIAVHYRQFTNMYLGQEHPYRSQFTRCKFEFDQVGLYLDGCTGFHVEENYFDQDDDYEFHNTGIVGKDAGVTSNEIYNNFFTTRFEVGITALNKNKGSDQFHGLQIKCNEFTELGPFTSDILVYENGTPTINSGIAQNQGSDASESSPAGNLFSRNLSDAWKDYVNQVDRTRIDYFMNDPQSEIRVEPRWYTNNIFLHNTNITFNKERSCKSHLTIPDPKPDPPHLRAELESFALKIDSARTELNTWVDGGNTDQLYQM